MRLEAHPGELTQNPVAGRRAWPRCVDEPSPAALYVRYQLMGSGRELTLWPDVIGESGASFANTPMSAELRQLVQHAVC